MQTSPKPSLRPLVSVLIVNYSTVADFIRCLSTLRQQEDSTKYEIRVHQNLHSIQVSEECRRIAEDYGVDWFYESMLNDGHGKGINNAAVGAHGVYYFILNPDCWFVEPVIDDLVLFLQSDRNACIVGPKQMDSKHRITAGGIVGTLDKPEHRFWHREDRANVLARDIVQSTVVAGSAMMIRKEDFIQYGGMLESNHYYSETWLNYHSAAHGRTNWYYGERVLMHEWHTSSPSGGRFTDGNFAVDRELFRRMCDDHEPPILHD